MYVFTIVKTMYYSIKFVLLLAASFFPFVVYCPYFKAEISKKKNFFWNALLFAIKKVVDICNEKG